MQPLSYVCACFDCMTCALGQHCGACRAANENAS